MRILHIAPGFYPRVGGEENLLLGWARQQACSGHQVAVVAPRDGPADVTRLDGIRIHRVRSILRAATAEVTPTLPAILLRERAEVFHSHYPMPWNAEWGVWIGRFRRKPVALTYCNDLGGDGVKGAFGRFYNRWVLPITLRLAHRIVVINPRYPELSEHLRPFRNKTVFIPPGVDAEYLRPLGMVRQPYTIFFVGALDEHHRYKGLEVLLRAVSKLSAELPGVRLVVAGKGPRDNIFARLARELRVDARVEFLGFASDEELRDWYNRCAVFVLPSLSWRQEGFGMVAVEAMACGAPTIVSSVVAVSADMEQAGGGLVVEPGDVHGLAEALRWVLTDPDLSDRLSREARQLVESRYTWREVGRRTLKLYDEMLSGRAKGG